MPLSGEGQTKARDVLHALQGNQTLRWLWTEDQRGDDALLDSVDRLLTTAVVVLGDEAPVMGSATREADGSGARLVLFSPTLVLVWDVIDLQATGVHTPVRVARRASVSSLEVTTGIPIIWGDRFDQLQRMQNWPGEVTVRAAFEGISGVIEVTGEGVDRYDLQRRTPVLNLLDGLVEDLRRVRHPPAG